jgi:hypothetical protein
MDIRVPGIYRETGASGVPEVYRVARVPGVQEDTGVPNY